MPKFVYKIIVKDNHLPECWYCSKRCRGVLIFPNGEEVWSCPKDAVDKGKIKRLNNLIENYPKKPLSSKKSNIPLVKKEQIGSVARDNGKVESEVGGR